MGVALRRRALLGMLANSTLAAKAFAVSARRFRILLRSSWQVVNIGDIAHTPGVLALLEKYFPEADVTLWASGDLTSAVAAMEHRRFPQLKIVQGTLGEDGRASNSALGDAVAGADFFLHGSGPSLVGARDLAAFVRQTGRPFGVYGVTLAANLPAEQRALLSQARFVFCRDSVSLESARSQGVRPPVLEFAPDGAFACDLQDDPRAEMFLQQQHLEPGKYLCCLSRLRYTPYWLVRANAKRDEARQARNEAMKEHDHRALRDALIAVVRETPLKVLLCPEDATQMAVGKEMFLDRLPDDVRERTVWRESFWRTDEALSVYRRSAGLFGSEMHSPIMAVGNGVPAIVCRFAEQTSKGIMWRDIGLGDWLFDLDQPADHPRIVPAVLDLVRNRERALEMVANARRFVERRQQETLQIVRQNVESTRVG